MINHSSCPEPEVLAAYVDGLLVTDAIEEMDRHIDHCAMCRGELSALATMFDRSLGRYSILRAMGRGSMGIVLRAYDGELERPVAVKLLASSCRAEEAQSLRREAQAMARLAHPNVVRVYDVTMHDGAIVIAMELVEGTTLRAKIAMLFTDEESAGAIADGIARHTPIEIAGSANRARDAAWREMLAVCIAAGRGLAAAHAARLVHRDFKPENVLCGDDGRVLVSDFGLARREDEPEGRAVRAGTPAYMAPEVLAGGIATAASDQFSFAVTTYEALHGERPFSGTTLDELRANIIAGIPRAATGIVPDGVRAVLVRSLAVDPARRFPSMDALLDALAAGARRRWPRASRITSETTWRNRPSVMRQPRRFRH